MALKTELVSKAKKLKIPRYSKLTKSELEKAIKKITGTKTISIKIQKHLKENKKKPISIYNCKEAKNLIEKAMEHLKDEAQNLFTKDAQWNMQILDSALASLRQAARCIEKIK